MSNKLNKKARAYLIATVISVALVSMGIALAYFQASIQGTGSANAQVVVSGEPVLSFEPGKTLAFDVSTENFGTYEEGNITDYTTSTATLTADGSAVSATYNVYFNITFNEFVYSEENVDLEAELVIVFYVDGEVYVPSNTGLTEVEVAEGVIGLDITTTSGVINVAEDYVIANESGVTSSYQKWTAELYFINLDLNQIDNSGKSYSAQFILGEIPLTLSDTILINNGSDSGGASSYEEAISYIGSKPLEDEDGVSIFNNTATTDEGMYAAVENDGTSYYFRGAVGDNWVYFAGYYWRIIRIDSEGNVRMIYSGDTAPVVDEEEGIDQSVVMTGTGTQLSSTYVFNTSSITVTDPTDGGTYSVYKTLLGAQYVYDPGVLHGELDSSTSEDSTIKGVVDNWFNTYIKTSSNYGYLVSATYCSDRTYYKSSSDYLANATYDPEYFAGSSSSTIYFAAYYRLVNTYKTPTLSCNDSDKLSLEVGLITADEVSLAGGAYGSSNANSSYYLYTKNSYWTLSPSYLVSASAGVFGVHSSGYMGTIYVYSSFGVRPVVSLSSEISNFKGSGTWNDPYEIV